jgi:hypothetical protein
MSGVLQQDAEIGAQTVMVTAAGFGKSAITTGITNAAAGGNKVNKYTYSTYQVPHCVV